MGRFVNPDNSAFQVAVASEIYIDKTGMLAYTNKAVEEHNAFIQGRRFPIKGDIVYLPTLKCDKVFDSVLTKLPLDAKVLTPNGLITKDTKYNPLKTLSSLSYVKFFLFDNS